MRERLLGVAIVLVMGAGILGTFTVDPDQDRATSQPRPTPSPTVSVNPSVSPTPSSGPSPTLSTTPVPSPLPPLITPAPQPEARLVWRTCEQGPYECATLPVPLDPERPDGRVVPLAVIKLPAAAPTRRIGTLVVNPGGPGASGYDWVLNSASAALSVAVLGSFDIIGFDPRGVGRSEGIKCASTQEFDVYFHSDPQPTTVQDRTKYTARGQAVVRGCQAEAGDLLAHVGTVEAAGDIDRIRRAIGEDKISFLGFSYGTYLGATWADLYPSTVRAAVFDGAIDPAIDLTNFVSDQGRAFEKALDRFFLWCDQSDVATCAFHIDGQPSGARYDAVAAAVHQTPIKGVPGRTLAFGELQFGVGYGMYSRFLWPTLGEALASAVTGDGSRLLSMSDAYLSRSSSGYDGSFAANTAVNCLDHSGPRSEDAWFDAAARTASQAPRLGFAIVYEAVLCAFWPVPARAARVPSGLGAPPLVVVGATHDPATPYEWSQALHKDLIGSRLITRARELGGDGHTSYSYDSPCTMRLVDAYLIDSVLPRAGATC